ncbi:MAG: hypothetical protein GY718_09660 [Lentisphaerae bacterium]|nr:hypothetical protein [Lentisphaerota bacterium]
MSNDPIYLWKSLRKGTVSAHNDFKWKVGKWYKVETPISICNNGFHASENIIHAMRYVECEVLAQVEVRGEFEKGIDKQCWSEMRIIKKWNWTIENSIELSIYSASLVLDNYEKVYPNDKRPREAIDAAKEYLKYKTSAAWSAARSAAKAAQSSAWSAWSTESAARSAWSAWSAARTTWSAARSARAAAQSAIWAAESAIGAAAEPELVDRNIHNWILKIIKKDTHSNGNSVQGNN